MVSRRLRESFALAVVGFAAHLGSLIYYYVWIIGLSCHLQYSHVASSFASALSTLHFRRSYATLDMQMNVVISARMHLVPSFAASSWFHLLWVILKAFQYLCSIELWEREWTTPAWHFHHFHLSHHGCFQFGRKRHYQNCLTASLFIFFPTTLPHYTHLHRFTRQLASLSFGLNSVDNQLH